ACARAPLAVRSTAHRETGARFRARGPARAGRSLDHDLRAGPAPLARRNGQCASLFVRRRRVRGFTLIEVLVALAIVAVALLTAVRAAGSMAQTNAELRLRLLAQLAADNRIAELRAGNAFPPIGVRTGAC